MADALPWEKYAAAGSGPWEKYAAASSQPTSAEIGAANIKANAEEHGPVQDVMSMFGAIPKGAGETLSGIGNAIEHPIDTAVNAVRRIPDAVTGAYNAVTHPGETLEKVKGITPEDVGKGIGGMAAGGAAGRAAGVLGDVAGPAVKAAVGGKPVSQTVRDLASKGVVTTPGMRGGKIGSAVEQRLTSVPLAGDMIKSARAKTTQQWNRAELNDAIKDAGGTPVPAARTGRDAIFHVEQEMKKAYSRVLGNMQATLDPAFDAQLQQIKSAPRLSAKSQKTVADFLDSEVKAKFKGGKIDGEGLKEIEETLRTEADDYRAGGYQDRKIATALDMAREQLGALLKKQNPQLAAELEGVDRGYAKFKVASKASLYSKKGEGAYTPVQKLRALAAKDKSKDKQRTASGQRAGQKETEAVERVIGNTEPDSGSAGRIATMEAVLGLGSYALHNPAMAIAGAASPILYSQPVLKALQKRALRRGQPYTPINPNKATAAGALLALPGTDQQGVAQ